MGSSTKVHKRVSRKVKSSANTSTRLVQPEQQLQSQASKKKKTLKEKTKQSASTGPSTSGPVRREGDHVLGGADYVLMLVGGRREAKKEGAKLPRGD
ncbi:hypothetical protein DFJ43DRAFT_1080618 [Lentinula guzmanii]|uniref:Uncharacterized protein n=1 Tax=Lentinula guzmanii TaxID=2804957 RepID=A0AA38MZ17_9AGAR|nr:hypothetical protein DFJ43DRAFT_1080618 [Lentinula guzmanii]